MLIETDRLLLRPMTVEDVDQFLALHAAPEVARFVPYSDRDQALRRLEDDQRHWRERGHGMLVVLDRASGRFLGRSGLRYWPHFDETELSWVFEPGSWGHGFATEAASACASWAFQSLPVTYLTALIVPDNSRSIAVARRLGMTLLRADRLFEHSVLVYSVSREAWAGHGSAAGRRATNRN